MDANLEEMINLIKGAQSALQPYQEMLKDPANSGLSHPDHLLTNFELMCKTLVHFYSKDNRAAYLPMFVNEELQTKLTTLKGSLSVPVPEKIAQPTALTILATIDSCYAITLKYGLITFGFDQKEFEVLVASANGMHAKISEIGFQMENQVKEFNDVLSSAHNKALGVYDDLVNKVKGELDVKIAAANESIEKAKAANQELETKIALTDQIATGAQDQFTKVQETSTSIGKTQQQLLQDYELLKETLSESKSILESIKDTKLAMKAQFDNIQDFYGEIESHKKKIADIKKDADEKFNHLSEECAKSTNEHTLKTQGIIETNQNLYVEIKAHLRNAISGTLFSAFSVRSGKLGKSKWAWAAILATCVAVGVSLTIMIAHDLSGKPDQAFFVKLSAMLPVLFLLGFSAKQYTNERRAEEEYAFKSTISVSLDPYRELLERITNEQGVEAAAFVKKLIEEVFDNPVKRIYPLKESLGEIKEDNILNVKEMLSNLTDIPAEQIKSVEAILNQVLSVIKVK